MSSSILSSLPTWVVLVTLALFSSAPSPSSRIDQGLFDQDTPLDAELTFDFREFSKEKYEEEYHPAYLKVASKDGNWTADSIRIRSRGNFRKQYCHLPPIKLNLKGSVFQSQETKTLSKIKMVTSCKNQDQFQQFVLREYLAYRIYQILTPWSFRVRLIRLKLIDSTGKRKDRQQYGFVIEPIKHLAERMDCLEIEPPRLRDGDLDRQQATLMYLFEYLVGNTDYSIGNLHNLKVIRPDDVKDDRIMPIPYDFDYTGLANTNYAIPHEKLGTDDVKIRIYLGACRGEAEWNQAWELIESHQAEILALPDQIEGLDPYSRNFCKEYLEDCFREFSKESRRNRTLAATCH
ncbi:hypothetical protein [Pontibacter sp. G13]|uniref:hypothetical protein n=1 Tax=Pontibacter sp. G13 TaxID=3074898 RepID=UPI00288BABFA|nr:hypothetical protein [Pontibacter sp. G13]WNJ19386.1 hypothetical protein RJD25_02740 [Pontibacter sp. G13]